MKKLRNRFERFCYRNRDKGIPNLMLYLTIGQALVYLFTFASKNNALYDFLCFDRDAVLRGEVWRLFSYPLTNQDGNILLVAISLICYYSLGRAMENVWGTFRFNLFYLSGMLLMDVFAMALGGVTFTYDGATYIMDPSFYADMGQNLNLSLFLGYATLYPDSRFLLLFIIPVKAWIFALFYLAITLYEVIYYSFIVTAFPHGLFPLVALGNYFLFFGKDVLNVIPMSWRVNARKLFKKKPKKESSAPKGGTIPFPTAGSYEASTASVKAPYTHRCTVCGRTDISDPDLEFRYCSRCNGYYCYCEDHISNHTHIE